MTLLWPCSDPRTQHYPDLTEEDKPGIQRCFFRTLLCLQQSDPHVLQLTWTHPGVNEEAAHPIQLQDTTTHHS